MKSNVVNLFRPQIREAEHMIAFRSSTACNIGIEGAIILTHLRGALFYSDDLYQDENGFSWFCATYDEWQSLLPFFTKQKIIWLINDLKQKGLVVISENEKLGNARIFALTEKGWNI